MRKLLALAVSLVLVAGAAGCSASGSDDAGPTTTEGGETTTTEEGETTTTEGGETTTTEAATTTTEVDPVGLAAAYADELAATLAAWTSDEGFDVTPGEAACTAEGWIDAIGVDRLAVAGVEPEDLAGISITFFDDLDLPLDVGDAMVDVLVVDCGVDVFDQFRALAGEGLSPADAACLEGQLDDFFIADVLAEIFVQPELSPDLEAELEAIEDFCDLSDEAAPDPGG